jgi:hypothetical protein
MTCGLRDPSQVEAESPTIADLIKVAETHALLAVAEAPQFSIGQRLARGPAADSGATSLDRAANGQYPAATHPGLGMPNLAPPRRLQHRAEDAARRRKHAVEDVDT